MSNANKQVIKELFNFESAFYFLEIEEAVFCMYDNTSTLDESFRSLGAISHQAMVHSYARFLVECKRKGIAENMLSEIAKENRLKATELRVKLEQIAIKYAHIIQS